MTRWTHRDGLTSTDVIGRLYQLGIATNRDRVAEVSNALFHPSEVRSSTPGAPGSVRRRWARQAVHGAGRGKDRDGPGPRRH